MRRLTFSLFLFEIPRTLDQQMATGKVGYARAVSGHTAESADGLSLFPGDVITIVSKGDGELWAVSALLGC
jgi:hypothetical protein